MQPLRCWAESALPGGDRVKVSENLGATVVVPVAPVDAYLSRYLIEKIGCLEIEIYRSGQQSRIEN